MSSKIDSKKSETNEQNNNYFNEPNNNYFKYIINEKKNNFIIDISKSKIYKRRMKK